MLLLCILLVSHTAHCSTSTTLRCLGHTPMLHSHTRSLTLRNPYFSLCSEGTRSFPQSLGRRCQHLHRPISPFLSRIGGLITRNVSFSSIPPKLALPTYTCKVNPDSLAYGKSTGEPLYSKGKIFRDLF